MTQSRASLPEDRFLDFVKLAGDRTAAELGHLGSGPTVLLTLLTRRVTRQLADSDSVVLPDGLTWAGFRVCFALWVAGPLEPHRLASLTSMSRAAVSAARKPLESRQLVTSVGSSTDQRSILLSLTPQGADLVLEIHERAMRNATEALNALTLPEQHLLVGLLGKVVGDEEDASTASDG
ncbi:MULTISPECIES: MarR family winged helix-turn-helix transcriptional regulator [Microbacterium]|uniref:MarR family winged helix-turn-helix transcriptional regulator n=1 Tax=Microbacterium TaxID=33882 RepID=UPI000B181095|nr:MULTISPECIES: MarR family transcriptional regulator [Microbacterium]CAH0146974.1 hypothetical protein SRABI98_00689 [Microbacterium sp. Bi98]CAH0178075.1 hypothetical protein SRABI03_01418 [Microbacterium foliorum]